MKTLTFTALILCCFVITSCSRYQVNLISSTNTNKNQQTGDFEFENDSVKIFYSFYGPDAPVAVSISTGKDRPWLSMAKQSATPEIKLLLTAALTRKQILTITIITRHSVTPVIQQVASIRWPVCQKTPLFYRLIRKAVIPALGSPRGF
jgi:hypothetical protein